MFQSKKQLENLENENKSLEKSITTLETKLRLQTTIATDLGTLNVDLTKQNKRMEEQLAVQKTLLKALDEDAKDKDKIIRELKRKLEEKQQKLLQQENEIKLLHAAKRTSEPAPLKAKLFKTSVKKWMYKLPLHHRPRAKGKNDIR